MKIELLDFQIQLIKKALESKIIELRNQGNIQDLDIFIATWESLNSQFNLHKINNKDKDKTLQQQQLQEKIKII